MSEYYLSSDLFVGTQVTFNSHKFILIDADEYAFHYMEKHDQEFSKSSLNHIMQRLTNVLGQNADECRSFFTKNDPSGNGIISYEQMVNLLRQVDPSVSDQEVMTLARYYCEKTAADAADARNLISVTQENLRKRNYEGFAKLLEDCMQNDKQK